jgi:chromosome segregation ATPase
MVGDSAAPLPNTGFEVVRKGYDQAQVEAHLRRLDAEMRILATDRDAAVDQSGQLTRELDDSRARAERLRAQVRTLVSPQQSVQGMSERMRSMLRMAEDEVAEMLARADTEVTKRLHDAEQQAATILESARADADATRLQMKADAAAAEEQDAMRRAELEAEARAHQEHLATTGEATEREIAEARARLDADRQEHLDAAAAADAAAERRRANAWAESEARRAQVEADFRIAMDQRRKEALTALTAEQLATRTATEELRGRADVQARQTVEAARAQAAEIVSEAGAAVVRLRAQRQRMVAQLVGSRSDLDALVASLAPLAEEDEVIQRASAAGDNGEPSRGNSPEVPADSADADTPPSGTATQPAAPRPSPSTKTVADHVAEASAATETSGAAPSEGTAQSAQAANGDRTDAPRPQPRRRTGAGARR